MTNSAPSSGLGEQPEDPTGTPRWVKVFGSIVIIVVLAFVIVMLTGGGAGGHGPERHAPSSAADHLTPG